VGHGVYSRQVRGVSQASWIVIWVQRFLCLACRRTMSLLPDWLHPYRWYAATVIIEAICRHTVWGESPSAIGERFGRPRDATTWRSLYRWRNELLISPTLWGWLGPRFGIGKPATGRVEAQGRIHRLLSEGGHPFRSTLDFVQAVPSAVRKTLAHLVYSRKKIGLLGQFPPGEAREPSPARSRPSFPTEKDSGRGPP